jgi:hypothetical protein
MIRASARAPQRARDWQAPGAATTALWSAVEQAELDASSKPRSRRQRTTDALFWELEHESPRLVVQRATHPLVNVAPEVVPNPYST